MDTTTKTVAEMFYAGGVLAAAYKGNRGSDWENNRTLLVHAVALEALTIGRLSRNYMEALCNRKLNVVDSGGAEPDLTHVTCPVCLAKLAKM